jgi:hypothetical protein
MHLSAGDQNGNSLNMNSSDWILVLVIGATIAGLILWPRGSSRERAEGWAPLAAVINGQIRGNGVTGTYHGAQVRAAILGCGETGWVYRLEMETDRRRWNWWIEYRGDKLFGLGEKHWRIGSQNESLELRLLDSGIIDLMATWPECPNVSYIARKGLLRFELAISEMPAPQRFQDQLGLLQELARTNRVKQSVYLG